MAWQVTGDKVEVKGLGDSWGLGCQDTWKTSTMNSCCLKSGSCCSVFWICLRCSILLQKFREHGNQAVEPRSEPIDRMSLISSGSSLTSPCWSRKYMFLG